MTSVVWNQVPDLFFVGFYVVVPSFQKQGLELQIGPYQSTILATPRIGLGLGVCGTAWKENATQVLSSPRPARIEQARNTPDSQIDIKKISLRRD